MQTGEARDRTTDTLITTTCPTFWATATLILISNRITVKDLHQCTKYLRSQLLHYQREGHRWRGLIFQSTPDLKCAGGSRETGILTPCVETRGQFGHNCVSGAHPDTDSSMATGSLGLSDSRADWWKMWWETSVSPVLLFCLSLSYLQWDSVQ